MINETTEYENFIKTNKMCDFTQSINWPKIKTYWLHEQIIIQEDKKIQLSAIILIRKIPIFGNMMYIPRGPIGEVHNKKALQKLTQELQKLAKKYHAFVILMEPDININDTKFINLAKDLGYKINSKAQSFNEEIQARHNLRLSLQNKTEEEIFNNFAPKTRYNIRLAQKKGVKIKEVGIDGLKDFYELLKITGARDNFIIRPFSYFESLFFYFENITILLAYYNDIPIAGIMPLTYGNKTWYLYGASSNEYRNLMPNYLLQWEAIKRAKAKNSCLYDFKGCSFKKGIPDGLYRFKKSFGTELIELIGEVNLEIKPLKYHLFKISKQIYFNIRKAKRKIKTSYK